MNDYEILKAQKDAIIDNQDEAIRIEERKRIAALILKIWIKSHGLAEYMEGIQRLQGALSEGKLSCRRLK